MNKILIIGGAGFIRVSLTRKLLSIGKTITVIDREKVLQPLDKVRYIKSDILNYENLDELVEEIDLVFNLASQLGIKYGIDKPVDQLENNIKSCERIVKICSKYKIRLIHASSSTIYRKNDSKKLLENSAMVFDNFNTFSWNYAFSKLFQEAIIFAYSKQYNTISYLILL